MAEKNPYNSDTPEYQLYENLIGAELAAISFDEDARRFANKATERRAFAARYRATLEILRDAAAAAGKSDG